MSMAFHQFSCGHQREWAAETYWTYWGEPDSGNVREELEREVRYANITVIEGIGASQYGIGMVSARLTEMILRDEGAVIPIGCYNATYGVTLSLPSVIGREGVRRVIEPECPPRNNKVCNVVPRRSRRRCRASH